MDNNSIEKKQLECFSTETYLAAELFSHLPESTQDAIIDLIKSLLSAE